jgi:hypothetical protein
MKALKSILLKLPIQMNLVLLRDADPEIISTASSKMQLLEIRRYLRELRKNREYNFTKNFVY